MKVRCKKMLSAAVVSAILAAQTLMPVAAAGGDIDADVTTISPVLRVQVPTKMAVAVNEFESGDSGSQISSDEFKMKNLSGVAVQVEVTSEALVGATIDLVSTKEAAKTSTAKDKPAMWLAAAAAVNDNAGKLEYLATGTDKTAGALTGEEDNATAFGAKDADNKSKVVQNFYLNEAKNVVYTGVTGKTAKKDVADASKNIGKGADYYLLTEVQDGGTSIITAAGAAKAAETQDIYVVADVISDTDSQTVIKYAKGTKEDAITGTVKKVYTIGSTPVANVAAVTDTDELMYISSVGTAATAGDAAFRYVGALSQAKSGWSSTDDLKEIKINYKISAISDTVYKELSKDNGLTYGYKAEAEASPITLNASGLMTIEGFVLDDFDSATIKVSGESRDYVINGQSGTWDLTKTPVEYQFNSTFTNMFKGKTVTIKINQKNSKPAIEGTVVVPAS